MIRLYSAREAQDLEHWAIHELGIPADSLMEAAGLQVALAMGREWGGLRGSRVSVFFGKGNNGGDGLVAARHLAEQGCEVRLWALAPREAMSPQAARQLQICEKIGLKPALLADGGALKAAQRDILSCRFLVDALLGTGCRGGLQGFPAEWAAFLASSGLPTVSVDLPSGLDASAEGFSGTCVQASLTVTFGGMKLALARFPGAQRAGKVVVADIGIPASAWPGNQGACFWPEPRDLRSWLPRRAEDTHKRRVGTALVIAGSRAYPGAAVLAGLGCQRCGAGMVRMAVPAGIESLAQSRLPEAVTRGLGQAGSAQFGREDLKGILDMAGGCQAAVLGPGLGEDEGTRALVAALYRDLPVPCVVDASALTLLAGGDLPRPAAARVLTPHAGEMARLSGRGAGEVEASRISLARAWAGEKGVVLVLKGSATLVAEPDGALSLNPTGNAGLAMAGSGDVLAGVIGGLLAQGMPPARGARAGAYLHGLAADRLARRQGKVGWLAQDLAQEIPKAMGWLEKKA